MSNDDQNTQSLLDFWREHGLPGRIGLFHLDFAPAKLINWGQKRLTTDGKPSPWVHCFLFLEPRDGIPWIAESDLSIPLPGLRKPKEGPQINPVTKWSQHVDRAAVVDAALNEVQIRQALARAEELARGGYTYGKIALVGTWIAVLRNDLTHHSFLHRERAMHCGQFARYCLRAADVDPWGKAVRDENTAPELIYQQYPVAAEWKKG